jgi:hypothetical protein
MGFLAKIYERLQRQAKHSGRLRTLIQPTFLQNVAELIYLDILCREQASSLKFFVLSNQCQCSDLALQYQTNGSHACTLMV